MTTGRPCRTAILAALALGGVSLTQPKAADFSDPSWPCIQRKVLHLAPGLMWTGPVIDDSLPDWRADAEIDRLAPVLAARRTSMEEAEKMVADFAGRAGTGEAKNKRLTLLFAAVFALIDRERAEIIGGIGRYSQKQIGLEGRIDAIRDEIATLEAKENRSFDEEDALEELQDKLIWDTRIFKERQQSLTYVCETPVILEQRAFALARAIAGHLD